MRYISGALASLLATVAPVLPPGPTPSPVPLRLNPMGRMPLGSMPMGYGPVPSPAPIFAPHVEAMAWLAGQLGMSVNPARSPGRPTYPRITYVVIDRQSYPNLTGWAGVSRYTIQIDAWSMDEDDPPILQAKIRRAFRGYQGPMGRTFCQGAQPGRNLMGFDPSPAQSPSGVCREMAEWDLFLTE